MICDSSIARPLSIIFKNCLRSGSFPKNWKNQMHLFIKKVTSNFHQTISLFLYCQYVVKFLRELLSTMSLNIWKKNSLLCPNQSGFRPFGSSENQLLSIVHDIYANFNQHLTLEVRTNFLDISKAFEKVWHEGLLFKLECIGIFQEIL